MQDTPASPTSGNNPSDGVFIPRWVIDLVPDDLAAVLLLSQLLWWHQPGPDGRPRVQFHRDGEAWLLRRDSDWYAETGLTIKQVRRIRGVLVSLGLVTCARFKDQATGAPTSAWRHNLLAPR